VCTPKGCQSRDNYGLMLLMKTEKAPGLPRTPRMHCVWKRHLCPPQKAAESSEVPMLALEWTHFIPAGPWTLRFLHRIWGGGGGCSECFSIPFLSQVQLQVTDSLWFRGFDQSRPCLLSKQPPLALVDRKVLFILFSGPK